jgi:hypothetical protein
MEIFTNIFKLLVSVQTLIHIDQERVLEKFIPIG